MEGKPLIQLAEKTFTYVSGRSLLRTTPKKDFLPYCMTKEKGEEIASHVGEELDIRFDSSPRVVSSRAKEMYSTFAQGRARLLDLERIQTPEEFKEFDHFYRFLMQVEDSEMLDRISTRKDQYIDSQMGFERFSSHWGTERWGCLTLDISQEATPIFRTDIDIFTPSSAKAEDMLVLGFYSHKPDWHKS